MSRVRPSRRKNCGVRPQFYAARARPCAAGNALSFYLCPFIWALAFCYNLTADLRGMNFLVFPYNAVLNAGVFDNAVSVSGSPQSSHSFTGAVRNLQPCSIIIWSASVSWNSPRVRMSLLIRCWSAFLSSLTSLM